MSLSVISDLWHRWLGHLSSYRLKTLSDSSMLENFQFSSSTNCEIYHFVKQTSMPFPTSNHMSLEVFELVHFNICGPAPISSFSSYNYYIWFIDDYSRYT